MTAGALRVLDGGCGPRGWEALWAKDRRRQRELPHGDLAIAYDREVVLRFDGLAQPWLKEAAKRWARARLLASLSPRSLDRYLRELVVFSRWLAERTPEVASPSAISRELLEDYMLYVRTRPWAQSTRRRQRRPGLGRPARRTRPASHHPAVLEPRQPLRALRAPHGPPARP